MENRFEILLDCKNNHIDMLLKDLEDAEEQNLKQYGAHAEIISQFLSTEFINQLIEFIISNFYFLQNINCFLSK
jgi:hypothetical protein